MCKWRRVRCPLCRQGCSGIVYSGGGSLDCQPRPGRIRPFLSPDLRPRETGENAEGASHLAGHSDQLCRWDPTGMGAGRCREGKGGTRSLCHSLSLCREGGAHSRGDWEEFVRLDRPGEVSGTGRMALRYILRPQGTGPRCLWLLGIEIACHT